MIMKNKLAKITCFAFVAAALIAAPALSRAADTNTPAAQPSPKKHGAGVQGKVTAVDATALTFTVGTNTLVVGSATKISKDGQPGVFSDITVGESVHAGYKKDAEGKLNATSVRIGEAKAKKKEAAPDAAAK
jgi:hypothetical protein